MIATEGNDNYSYVCVCCSRGFKEVRRVAPSGSLENFASHRCLEATTVPQENVWNLAPQQPRGGERYLLLCLCFCLLNKLRFTDAPQRFCLTEKRTSEAMFLYTPACAPVLFSPLGGALGSAKVSREPPSSRGAPSGSQGTQQKAATAREPMRHHLREPPSLGLAASGP